MRMFVAKDDCHIGSDRMMSQELSQTSPMSEGAGGTRCRKTENVDLPQIVADLGNPQSRLEKEKNDLNVECYFEKLEGMLQYQELMLVDLLKSMRKVVRRGTRASPRYDEQGGKSRIWSSGLGLVRSKSRNWSSGVGSRIWSSGLGHVGSKSRNRSSGVGTRSRTWSSCGDVTDSKATVAGAKPGTSLAFLGESKSTIGKNSTLSDIAKPTFSDEGGHYPSQTVQARQKRNFQDDSEPTVWRLPPEAMTTSSTHRNIWRFLEDRNSGLGAMFIASCLSLIELSNTVILFFDVCFYLDDSVLWLLIVCHFILAAEFLVRFHVAPSQAVFMCHVQNIFEMICIGIFSTCFVNRVFAETRWHEAQQPFYQIWFFLPALMMMRTVRRFKIFQLLSGALNVALEVLPVLLYSLGIIIASFAAVITAVEPRENVASYGEALWLVIVTVFTVGYGDYAPSTDHGRLACSVLMMISCLYMAIPIGIVGTAFTRVWDDKERLMALQNLRDQISWSGLGVEDTLRVFEMYTEGGCGGITLDAFKSIILGFRCVWRDEVVQHVFNLLDEDGCGELDVDEFLFGLFPMQRFFWKQTVERVKTVRAATFQNLPTCRFSDLEEKAEENPDAFRPNRHSAPVEL